MRLTDFAHSDHSVKNTANTQQLSPAQAQLVSRQIKALSPGQTIQGEVLSRNGNEVQVRLSDDMVLNARLNQNMALELGKLLTFEVKNNGQSLTLSPLFANMASDVNVLKALDMAALPVNQSTISMTTQMMEAGMSVDRSSLQQVFREMNVYAGGEADSVIALHRLGLPVNDQNVQQMQTYQNLTHQLMGGIDQLMEDLTGLIQGNAQSGTGQELTLFGQILELAVEVQNAFPEGIDEPLQGEGKLSDASVGSMTAGEEAVAADEAMLKQAVAEQDSPIPQITTEQKLAEALRQLTTGTSEGSTALNNRITLLEQGQLSNQEQLQLLKEVWDHALAEGNGKELTRLLGGDALPGALTRHLQEFMTIRPEELAEDGKVEELYKRLDLQLKGLEKILADHGQNNSAAYRSTVSLSQNVDFMQQMNQMYTYVQLPLKFLQGEAHGELYVYTNKKHLASSDGQVSALLHLDMEHLGPLDIYVALKEQKVNTKFYLQDDTLLDFLAEHMDLLNARLEKRGYQMQYEMQVRAEAEAVHSGVEPLLPKGTGIRLAEYAFDAKA